MANLWYQVGCICNKIKFMQLCTAVRDFLDWIIWDGKAHPKSGPHILVAAHLKDMKEGSLCFFACLPTLSLAGLSTLCLSYSFADIRIYFFRLQHRLNTRSSLGTPQDSSTRRAVLSPISLDWTITEFLPFPSGAAIAGWITVCKNSNNHPPLIYMHSFYQFCSLRECWLIHQTSTSGLSIHVSTLTCLSQRTVEK